MTGILQDDTISGSSAGNGSSTATEHPGQRISTVSWQELQQQLQDSQQQGLVILDVLVKPGDQQQQQPIRCELVPRNPCSVRLLAAGLIMMHLAVDTFNHKHWALIIALATQLFGGELCRTSSRPFMLTQVMRAT